MKKLIIVMVLILILGLFYWKDPMQSSWFLICPLKLTTGYDCPGCGSQRALHQLLHFNFKQAFLLNPLLFLFAPYALLGLFLNFKFLKHLFPNLQKQMFGIKFIMVAVVVILFFFVLRNTEAYLTWINDTGFKA